MSKTIRNYQKYDVKKTHKAKPPEKKKPKHKLRWDETEDSENIINKKLWR